MKDLLDILQAMAENKARTDNPLELFLDMSERVVKYVAGAFGAKMDEVAILLLTTDARHLRFVAPRKFADLGTIPVTKRDSIAVNIFGRKVGEAMNNVPMVKHVAFFESVKLRDRAVPIQKMITVPILQGEDAIGQFRGVAITIAPPCAFGYPHARAGVNPALAALGQWSVYSSPDRM